MFPQIKNRNLGELNSYVNLRLFVKYTKSFVGFTVFEISFQMLAGTGVRRKGALNS